MPSKAAPRPLDVFAVHQAHGPFVFRSLQRLGARPSDVEDLFQDVFVVVHRRLSSFDFTSDIRTWLYGICIRVARAHRRRAWFRREAPSMELPETHAPVDSDHPEEALATKQARAMLDRVLGDMDLEKRAVFVMFEIDELPSEEIAQVLGIPVGTVWSRLSHARKQFQTVLLRHQARAQRGEVR